MQFFKLDQNWEFVVVGSDGVWDAMSSSEMAKYIKARIAPYHYVHGKDRDKVVLSELCEQILDTCCAKTVSHYGKNSCDNMTIIIIWFDHSNRNGTARSETGSSIKSSSGVSSASR
jgi:serine/threonine protein phosphatase PrpC